MRLILSILFSLLTLPVFAQCVGENLLDAMTPAKRVELAATVANHPYPSGNLWQAQKGDSIIHVMGTVHLSDPRLNAYLEPLWPVIDTADLVFAESNLEAMEQVKTAALSDPSFIFIKDGPTLPDLLTADEWAQLSAEMSARGTPGFLASKMKPFFVAITLGMPPCATASLTQLNGVDQRILHRAKEHDIPAHSLEPFDTAFKLFNDTDSATGLNMIRAVLATSDQTEATFVTLLDAYFSGDHRAIWELSRLQMLDIKNQAPAVLKSMFDDMEYKLLTKRNISWLKPILGASKTADNIVVAVGAAHLSGEQGLLNLLHGAGYTLTRVKGF